MTLYSASDLLNSMDRAFGLLVPVETREPARQSRRFMNWVRTFFPLA